ncbi:transposase [Pseudonocardia sp. T1-2H]|uniref:transposase n=1 Tax=Pseudonocardia sp. T1-2H TaxID=3128899 RepID=UPI003100C69F
MARYRSGPLRAFLRAQRGWLTVHYLPAYASELNPTENLWVSLKTRDLAIRAAATVEELLVLAHRGVHRLRRRPDLLGNFLVHTRTAALQPNRKSPLIRRLEFRSCST